MGTGKLKMTACQIKEVSLTLEGNAQYIHIWKPQTEETARYYDVSRSTSSRPDTKELQHDINLNTEKLFTTGCHASVF